MNAGNSWTVYRTRFVVRARQLTMPLTFTDALGREHSGQAGDYLVESSEGFRRITPQTLFEDIYVPLEQTPPPAQVARRTDGGVPVQPAHEDRVLPFRSDPRRLPAAAWGG